MSNAKDKEFLNWLGEECGYVNAQRIPDTNLWVSFERLMFHWSLISGPMHDYATVTYRYCYSDLGHLATNFVEWSGRGFLGEPNGWHKRRGPAIDINKPIEGVSMEEFMELMGLLESRA